MVNRLRAAFQFCSGIDHFLLMFANAKKTTSVPPHHWGNAARFLVILRRLMFTDSMALVV